MNCRYLIGAVALGCVLVPGTALADDPNDPTMRSAAARAKDRELTRRLNEAQLRHVRERDAGYAEGWQAYRDYPQAQADHDRRMAEWRHAVDQCEAGRWEYCAQ